MPRYFFDVQDGKSFPDYDGCELPDLDAARIEAVRLLGGMLRDEAETFWQGEDWRMSVCDADRMMLFSIQFMATMAPAMHDMAPPTSPMPGAFAGTFGASRMSASRQMPAGI